MNKEKSRAIASILGLAGGIFGLYSATFPIVKALEHVHNVSDIWQIRGLNILIPLYLVTLIFAIIGLIGAIKVKSKNKIAGSMMLISAFGGVTFAFTLYGTLLTGTLAFIFLLAAGIMAFRE